MTESELILWNSIRNRKLSGCKFLRQHPIIYKADFKGLNYFVADFYCAEKKAVVELDGPVHDEQIEYDQFRDEEMQLMGLHILRLKNEELDNIEEVLEKIDTFLASIH